ncbi:MAG: hypothetical protein U9O94_04780 [Nanoarchaeota archaeon]|nr:hypothetical protein [Nanoarchaeota archaeon]
MGNSREIISRREFLSKSAVLAAVAAGCSRSEPDKPRPLRAFNPGVKEFYLHGDAVGDLESDRVWQKQFDEYRRHRTDSFDQTVKSIDDSLMPDQSIVPPISDRVIPASLVSKDKLDWTVQNSGYMASRSCVVNDNVTGTFIPLCTALLLEGKNYVGLANVMGADFVLWPTEERRTDFSQDNETYSNPIRALLHKYEQTPEDIDTTNVYIISPGSGYTLAPLYGFLTQQGYRKENIRIIFDSSSKNFDVQAKPGDISILWQSKLDGRHYTRPGEAHTIKPFYALMQQFGK